MPRRAPSIVIVAALLLALGGALLLRPPRGSGSRTSVSPAGAPAAPRLVTVEVGGMVCSGCVARIESQLTQVPGVARADVSLRDRSAHVLCDSTVSDTALTAAVRRAGPEYLGIVVR